MLWFVPWCLICESFGPEFSTQEGCLIWARRHVEAAAHHRVEIKQVVR